MEFSGLNQETRLYCTIKPRNFAERYIRVLSHLEPGSGSAEKVVSDTVPVYMGQVWMRCGSSPAWACVTFVSTAALPK